MRNECVCSWIAGILLLDLRYRAPLELYKKTSLCVLTIVKTRFFFLKKFSASCTKFRCFHVGSFTCSSSFSMAAARITSGPLQCLIKKLSPIQSWDQTDPYLTAYSMVLMHGLIFSIWRHFPLAPNDDIFLGELMLLMHWIGDTVEDRHK